MQSAVYFTFTFFTSEHRTFTYISAYYPSNTHRNDIYIIILINCAGQSEWPILTINHTQPTKLEHSLNSTRTTRYYFVIISIIIIVVRFAFREKRRKDKNKERAKKRTDSTLKMLDLRLSCLAIICFQLVLVKANFECTAPIPLGCENGVLPDSAFTASSYSSSREPWRARQHGQFGKFMDIKITDFSKQKFIYFIDF